MNNGHIRRRILGVSIDAPTMKDVVDRADVAIEERRPLQIGVVNAAKVVNMRRDAELAPGGTVERCHPG